MKCNRDYIIFMEPEKKHISTGDSLRIDLFNGFKISDVPELRVLE